MPFLPARNIDRGSCAEMADLVEALLADSPGCASAADLHELFDVLDPPLGQLCHVSAALSVVSVGLQQCVGFRGLGF